MRKKEGINEENHVFGQPTEENTVDIDPQVEEDTQPEMEPQVTEVTRESVLGDIEDMLGRMGNAPGVDNVKAMIAELKDLN